MPTPLTDADKVLRNDTGKDIVEKLNSINNTLLAGSTGLASRVIADAYDSTSPYEVGDYVIYENLLYKCNTGQPCNRSHIGRLQRLEQQAVCCRY